MSNLLADRLDGSPVGLVPWGYVMASQLLRYDCEVTGKNGFNGKPMPQEATGLPGIMYGFFFNIKAVDLARGAFGDQFADAVQAIYKDVHESMEAKAQQAAETEAGVEALGAVEDATDPHQAVARWWARAVLNPKFDNGDNSDIGLKGRVMAVETATELKPEVRTKLGAFSMELERLSRERDLARIDVDYHPSPPLTEAAALAGMPITGLTTFPWKTTTYITDDIVEVSDGYGQPAKRIWPPVEA